MENSVRLARLLPPRDLEPGLEYTIGVESPDICAAWLRRDRWLFSPSSFRSDTRLVELSRFTNQLWPFSSRVDDARANPALNIHSESWCSTVLAVFGRDLKPFLV